MFLVEFVLLAPDFHFFQFGEVAQSQIKNGFRLDIGQLEALHQRGLGCVLFPDDGDDFIDAEIRNQQAIENVQAISDDLQAVTQAIPDRVLAKFEPFPEYLHQPEQARASVQADDVHVDAQRSLQRRRGEQVRHQFLDIDAALPADDQARRIFMV